MIDQARTALERGLPFFVHVTPVLPHWTTCYGPFKDESKYAADDPHWEMQNGWPISPCPTSRHKAQFEGQTNAHLPHWNVLPSGQVPARMQIRALNGTQAAHEDQGWRDRSSGVVDLDDMIVRQPSFAAHHSGV